jgi:hypothetical protein
VEGRILFRRWKRIDLINKVSIKFIWCLLLFKLMSLLLYTKEFEEV